VKILVVCCGNLCRSPMAAEYLRDRLARQGLSHVVVESAGTLGIRGRPATPEAVETLRRAGLDLGGHRSSGVRAEDVATADLIVVMTLAHQEEIEREFPAARGRIVLLRAFERGPDPIPGAPDLEDPIGRPLEEYAARFEEIRTSVDHLVLNLKHR